MKSILLLLLANLSLQCGAVIAKLLFVTLGALQVSIARLVLSALMLIAVQRPWRLPFSRLNGWAVLAYGVSLAGMNVLFYQAISRIPMGIAVAVEFVGPLTVALFSSRGWKNTIWVLLAASGLALFSIDALHAIAKPFTESAPATLDPFGLLLALLSGLCWGAYILSGKFATKLKPRDEIDELSRPLNERESNRALNGLTAFGMAIGALLVLPMSANLSSLPPIAHTQSSRMIFGHSLNGELSFALMLLGLALLSSAVPYSLEMIALHSLSITSFGILMSLQPAVAAVVALLVLNEKLSGVHWLAIALIIIASVGVTISNSKAERARVEPLI